MSNDNSSYLPNPMALDELKKLLAEATNLLPVLQTELIPAIAKSTRESLDSFHHISEMMRSPAFLSNFTNAVETSKHLSEYAADLISLSGTAAASGELTSTLLTKSLEKSLSSAAKYMTPEQRKTIEGVIPEALDEPSTNEDAAFIHKKKWNIHDLHDVLGVLLALITLIVTILPDKQLDFLAEQNATIIQQNEEIIASQAEEIEVLRELLQSAQDVSEAIEDLTQGGEDIAIAGDDSSEALNSTLNLLDPGSESDDINTQD